MELEDIGGLSPPGTYVPVQVRLLSPVPLLRNSTVECLTVNQDVVGSNPIEAAMGVYSVEVAVRPVKPLSKGSGGSTPSAPTMRC